MPGEPGTLGGVAANSAPLSATANGAAMQSRRRLLLVFDSCAMAAPLLSVSVLSNRIGATKLSRG